MTEPTLAGAAIPLTPDVHDAIWRLACLQAVHWVRADALEHPDAPARDVRAVAVAFANALVPAACDATNRVISTLEAH